MNKGIGRKIKNIEVIDRLKSLDILKKQADIPEKPYKEVRDHLIKFLRQTPKVVENRLKGLYDEDEFLLFALMLGNIEQITRLEQKNYLISKQYSIPDFLIGVKVPKWLTKEEKPLVQRFFVEAKKLKEGQEEFIISHKLFQQLEFYGMLYSLPVYFALKFELPHINYSQWFLVPTNTMKEVSKSEKRMVFNRNEDCYVVKFFELIAKDYSCLWLSNYTIHIGDTFKITKSYLKGKKGGIQDVSLGRLESVKCESKDGLMEARYDKDLDFRELLFFVLCKYLSRGKKKEETLENSTKIEYDADTGYMMQFYHIVLEAYLHIRTELQKLESTGDTSVSYYLENFSEKDQNIILLLKDILFEMNSKKIIMLIRMMPESFFPKEKDDKSEATN